MQNGREVRKSRVRSSFYIPFSPAPVLRPRDDLLERIKEGRALTVLDVMHHHAKDTGLLRDVETIPLWLQLIHSGNVTNHMNSARVRFAMDLEKEFGIPGPTRINAVRSIALAVKHRLIISPIRFVRRVARGLLKG